MKTLLITASLLLVGLAGLPASAAAPGDAECVPDGEDAMVCSFDVADRCPTPGTFHWDGMISGYYRDCSLRLAYHGNPYLDSLGDAVTVGPVPSATTSAAAPGGAQCVPEGDNVVVCSFHVGGRCPAPGTFHWDGDVSGYYRDCSLRITNHGSPLVDAVGDAVDVVGPALPDAPVATSMAAPGGAECVPDGEDAMVCSFDVAGRCPAPGTFHWDGKISGYYTYCSLRLAYHGDPVLDPLVDGVDLVGPAPASAAQPVDMTCYREAGVIDCTFSVAGTCPAPVSTHVDGVVAVSYSDCRVRISSVLLTAAEAATGAVAGPCSADLDIEAGCSAAGTDCGVFLNRWSYGGCTTPLACVMDDGEVSSGRLTAYADTCATGYDLVG